MSLFDWFGRKQVVAIVDNQFGDSGKGKLTHLMSEWADITVRGTGGANAGHTVCVDGRRYALHLLPCGIVRDDAKKMHIIGHGVAFDPRIVIDEIDQLTRGGISCDTLRISHRATLVLPYHILEDRLRESAAGANKIGTTGRGVGPAYMDRVGRCGLTVNDMLNSNWLVEKIRRAVTFKPPILNLQDHIEVTVDDYLAYGKRLAPHICDTDVLVRNSIVQGKRVLLEGAQGLLLSVDYGTYPYVTSSDCSVRGLAAGAGLTMRDVEVTLGVTKAFYMTRVGEGPFPTELGGQQSRNWCASATREAEANAFPEASLQSSDPFLLGIGIRKQGNEYGTTTGRARRVGWLDLPLLRYAMQINGPDIALTMLDVLDACPKIQVCTQYRYDGPLVQLGVSTLRTGEILHIAIPEPMIMQHCVPVYETVSGWECVTGNARAWQDLPVRLQELIRMVEVKTQSKVRYLSVGPDHLQTIAL